MSNNTDLLTIKNWAKQMDVTTSYVYKLIKDGRVVPTVVDGVKFIDLGEYPSVPKKEKL